MGSRSTRNQEQPRKADPDYGKAIWVAVAYQVQLWTQVSGTRRPPGQLMQQKVIAAGVILEEREKQKMQSSKLVRLITAFAKITLTSAPKKRRNCHNHTVFYNSK